MLGLGDREALREGFACAVLRRSDHRDTYDAMFDLFFPAALGAKTVLLDDDDEADDDPGLPPEDVEAMRADAASTCSPRTTIWPTWTSGWRR